MFTEFSVKRQALFDSLDNAALVELKGTTLEQTQKIISVDSVRKINSGNNYSHLRGKQSIFKRPAAPIRRCLKSRYTPDFKINPHKWTKYSLRDVDISDITNAAGASAFLREQEMLHATNTEEEMPTDNNMKIKFHKGVLQLKRVTFHEDNPVDEKPQFRGTKLLMPEHVIGQKKSLTKTARKQPQQQQQQSPLNKEKQLNLSHLYEEEEEED